VDLDAGTVSVRRSAGMIRVAGESAEVTEGDTKSGKPRVVDIDAATVTVLRAHRKARGAMALQLARDGSLVFADHEGRHLQPEHFSRSFADALRRCAKQLAAAAPPAIRLHDLRHTHATILLTAGVPVHVVSQRLGHASPVITLQVYAHVVPGSQRDAADLFARIIAEAAS
jgi:integrase